MAPVEGRNVRSMFITSCLAVIFGLKLFVLISDFAYMSRAVDIKITENESKTKYDLINQLIKVKGTE